MGLVNILYESFTHPVARYRKGFKQISTEINTSVTNRFMSYTFPEKSPIFYFFKDAAWFWGKRDRKNVMSYITPYQFLKLSATGNPVESTYDYFIKYYRENDDIQFGDVPYFRIDKDQNGYKITGHEGRHRASILIMMGYGDNIMPLRLSSPIGISGEKSITVKGENSKSNIKHTFNIIE